MLAGQTWVDAVSTGDKLNSRSLEDTPMPTLSPQDIARLADRFGIDINEDEADTLRETVETRLDRLDPLFDRAHRSARDAATQSWEYPAEDPHNSITVECAIEDSDPETDVLAGRHIGVKDNIAVAGVPMQCASAVMQGFVPSDNATVVDRLLAAGGTITCKTNLDEFAGAPLGTTAHSGHISNPYDEAHVPGGSSSGSAVCVATHRVDVALGTDTGGSIRIPASFCGTVGFKPTYGVVPLDGVVENTYTADHVGPLSRTVTDAARALTAIAGRSERDPASLQAAGRPGFRTGDYLGAVRDPPDEKTLQLGVLTDGFEGSVVDAVADRTKATVDRLADAGADVRSVTVDCFDEGEAIKDCLSFVEMAVNWRAGGIPYRRSKSVSERFQSAFAQGSRSASGELNEFYKTKLLAGAYLIDRAGGKPYTRAQAARGEFRAAFEAELDGVDALVLPTMPDTAPRVDDALDPGFDYGRNTRAANLGRIPAITLPNGLVDGLPIGLQLLGSAFHDDHLLGTAATFTEYTESMPAP